MDNIAIENFINFCDDMQIAEESSNSNKFASNNSLGGYIKSAINKSSVSGITILFQTKEDYKKAISSYKLELSNNDLKKKIHEFIEKEFVDYAEKTNYKYYIVAFGDGPEEYYVTFDSLLNDKKRNFTVEIKNPYFDNISWKSYMPS